MLLRHDGRPSRRWRFSLVTSALLVFTTAASAMADAPAQADLPGVPAAEVKADAVPAEADASPRLQITQLIEELGDANFETRIGAERQLAERAREAPEELAELARRSDAETATRIVQILERTFQKHDGELGDRAERALEALSQSESPAATQAAFVLRGNSRLRESRARKAIERLGGELGYMNPREVRIQPPAVAAGTGVGFGEPVMLYGIWLHSGWEGTKEDLWHLRRLGHWPNLTIYSIRGNGVSREELNQLNASVPGLRIEERGPCLGIQSRPDLLPCQVTEVLPNGAAAEAGLMANDEITGLNGQPVRNFSHLVERLKEHEVGEEIVLAVERNGEPLEIKVTLGSWRGVARREGQNVSPPKPFDGPFGVPPADAGPTRRVPPPVPLPVPLNEDEGRM
jgi:hypothetical protein